MDNYELNQLHSMCHYRQPLVSIVIPCYNTETYIAECIESAINQDYQNKEIIVVNDGSTDKSLDIAIKYPVKIIDRVVNQGECITSALGFEEAKGKYICRLSADDMFVNVNHISIQVAEMEKYNLDWCYNSQTIVGETIPTSIKMQTSWVKLPIRNSSYLLHYLDNIVLRFQNICYIIAILGNPINSSCMMIRADTYHKHLTWRNPLRTVCDSTLIAKMFTLGLKVRSIHSMGSFYRINPGQQTGKPETNAAYIKLRTMLCDTVTNGSYPAWMKFIVRLL